SREKDTRAAMVRHLTVTTRAPGTSLPHATVAAPRTHTSQKDQNPVNIHDHNTSDHYGPPPNGHQTASGTSSTRRCPRSRPRQMFITLSRNMTPDPAGGRCAQREPAGRAAGGGGG